MKTPAKYALAAALGTTALLAGCGEPPASLDTKATPEEGTRYELLMVRKGCEIGRIKSDSVFSKSVYTAICPAPGSADYNPSKNIDNPTISYTPLHTRFGCETGRLSFSDGPATRHVYFTLCPEKGDATTRYDQNCGKGCTENIRHDALRP